MRSPDSHNGRRAFQNTQERFCENLVGSAMFCAIPHDCTTPCVTLVPPGGSVVALGSPKSSRYSPKSTGSPPDEQGTQTNLEIAVKQLLKFHGFLLILLMFVDVC